MTISLQRSFNQVKALLENLLSWSRSQMNLLECKPEPVDLEVFIQGHASIYRQTAINKNITLQVEVEKGLLAMTDYNILSAVLRNLITNALKYSHPNATVFIETRSDGVDKVCVCVRDTGVGMSAQTLRNLFKIEYKSSVPGTMNEKGTGLGLILIRDFLRLLASDLNVESEEGQGSAFSFNLNRTWAEDDSTVGEKRLVLEAV